MLVLQPDCSQTVEIITPRVFMTVVCQLRHPAVNWVQRLFNCYWADTLIAYVNIYPPTSKDLSSLFVFVSCYFLATRGAVTLVSSSRVGLVRLTVFRKSTTFSGVLWSKTNFLSTLTHLFASLVRQLTHPVRKTTSCAVLSGLVFPFPRWNSLLGFGGPCYLTTRPDWS